MTDATPSNHCYPRRMWDAHVYPRLLDRVCATHAIIDERKRWVPRAHGHVLEVGVGSGLNLELYAPERVGEVVGLDPSPVLLARAANRARKLGIDVTLVAGVAEQLPFETARFDTVVFTYTLCSVDDLQRSLVEAHRVLRAGGQLVFVEHGASPIASARRWQQRITPVWKHVAGNCHLDRDVPHAIEAAGFALDELDARRDRNTSWMSFAYSGIASR